jgi:hypothetical protein
MKRKTNSRATGTNYLDSGGRVAANRVVAGGGIGQEVSSLWLARDCPAGHRIDRPLECGEREKRGQQIRGGKSRFATRYGRYHGEPNSSMAVWLCGSVGSKTHHHRQQRQRPRSENEREG